MITNSKLLLTIEDVAGLTGLPDSFWIFVAENENNWDIERFVFAAGSYRITPYYLDAYLQEDLGFYYRLFEEFSPVTRRKFDDRRRVAEAKTSML